MNPKIVEVGTLARGGPAGVFHMVAGLVGRCGLPEFGNRSEGGSVAKLDKEQVVTIRVLHKQGNSNSETARLFGVTEATVRYHLRRGEAGATDGRVKTSLVERLGLAEAVAQWWSAQAEVLSADRPPNVRTLYEWLKAEHGYAGSYKSVRKYARSHFAAPRLRPFRRVETPPGAQTQTDWAQAWSVRGVSTLAMRRAATGRHQCTVCRADGKIGLQTNRRKMAYPPAPDALDIDRASDPTALAERERPPLAHDLGERRPASPASEDLVGHPPTLWQ